MRTLRSFLTVTVMLALLGGAGNAVLAQADEGGQADRGPFSASIVDFLEIGDMNWVPGPPHGRLDDWRMVLDVEATDPRLSGTWTMVQSGHGFGEPGTPEAFGVYVGTVRLRNEDGVWVGEVLNFNSDPYERMRLVVEGEDGYAGLTAIIDQGAEFGEFQGIVFDYGLPQKPDPVEPSAE